PLCQGLGQGGEVPQPGEKAGETGGSNRHRRNASLLPGKATAECPHRVGGGGYSTYPLGGCLGSHLGAQRPVAPPARRGSPFLPRNGEKEGRGQAPWTPGFYGRSFPLAGFWVGCL